MLKRLLLGTLAAVSVNSAMAANSSFYRIKIPAGNLSCEQEAEALGQRYAQISKILPLKVTCSGPSKIFDGKTEFKLNVLDLNYPNPVSISKDQIHSTYYGISFMPSQVSTATGMYDTFSACLSELASRTKEFEQKTGVLALSSTCEKASSTDYVTYILRVDTVGTPKVRLFSVADELDFYKGGEFNNVVEKLIKTNQGQIVAHSKKYYFYFAQEPVIPRGSSFGKMRIQDCDSQIGDLKAMLSKQGITKAFIGCSEDFIGSKEFRLLKVVSHNLQFFSSDALGETYSDFAECQRDKSRVVSQYAGYGKTVSAAICRYQDVITNDVNSQYSMDVYY